ncbi:hypothetical protein GAGA_1894 [Paraglaciecola agarilytica NO2]|uniref:Uncharacterized protein n=1 Tax=Paraglaciecola agarilytica NO2 TaxID=1125747 RepID=A0ABQ0I5Y9_9ALTE|nr:hypothetical protein GAGA_1894 [Paraglaciecola agarilytica NO2]
MAGYAGHHILVSLSIHFTLTYLFIINALIAVVYQVISSDSLGE